MLQQGVTSLIRSAVQHQPDSDLDDRDVEERLAGPALEARIRDVMGRAEAEILTIEVCVLASLLPPMLSV